MRKRWLKLAALPMVFAFVAAACGSDDNNNSSSGGTEGAATTTGESTTTAAATGGSDASGTTTTLPKTPGKGSAGQVTVFGVEDSANEAGAMQDALTKFGDANGIKITYVGRRDFEQQINSQVLGGNPPDIGAFPQPGKLAGFAKDGSLQALPDEVATAVAKNWDPSFLAFSKVDDKQYGVPIKNDLKSLVWYVPSVWKSKGYEVPKTLADFKTLEDKMIANGDTPLCVGIESGAATGWPFTDWVEELVLREQGIDYYNKWVAHEVPFDDKPVVDAFNEVAGPDGIWNKKGAVYASGGSIASTAFGDNGEPLTQGKCMMHRQANFFSAFFPKGTKFGTGDGEVSTFYFPSDEGHPVLVGGINVGAFRDAPEVWKVMTYLGSPEYANDRQQAQSKRVGGGNSGFLTGNKNADPKNWDEQEQGFLKELATANPAAFDASDQMPADVGSGSFWKEGTSFVNGDEDAKTAAANIEASWPS